ncbi:hypothetical protein Taro_031407 [Colocasia esculenta]|uniref:GATA transcription factor n=1 Tax=Colocasia esculenta TaxID=4460 RepID=A0A843W332_COLES|nr:hypothetical protein [Colocasia esculenta]
MDCVQTSLLRDAGRRGDMAMFSAAGHQQNHQFAGFPPVEEEVYANADRGGLLWENFSVDDLLDLGSGAEEQSFGDEEELFGFEDLEEVEEEERERGVSPDNSNASVPSAVSFQAPPPSSDLVVPAGDVAELEWVSRFVDDSYSEFASSSVTPPFHHHSAPAPALLGAAARSEASEARFTNPGAPSKRNWGSCFFFADSLVVPSKARSKRSRTGGRVWSLRGPPFLADSSSAAASCSASSASSCSISSSSSSISPMLLYDGFPGGFPTALQPQQMQMKKKRGRKPKAAPAGAPRAADGAVAELQPRRRCTHCGVDRTPQWRAGPMGAKTLCNACGVRYKSGRLLPEYRPAGSPTFLSQLHSNSHRKVLEMRRNKELAAASSSASCSTPPPTPPAAAAAQLHGVV